MELKIYIRQKKTYDENLNEIFFDSPNGNRQSLQRRYVCTSTVTTNCQPFPNHRKLPNYHQWIDVTDEVSDLFKLKLTYSIEAPNAATEIVTDLTQKRAFSGTITFEGDAYQYLKKWLVDDISALVNVIEVQIEHVGCGSYQDLVISAKELTWCEDNICTFDVNIKQKEESMTCITNTLITDNWQGWFPTRSKIPSNGKKHPRFSYCNEIRPNGMLVFVWWLILLLMPVYTVVGVIIGTLINSIILIMISILALFAVFSQKVRDKIKELEDKMIQWDDITDLVDGMLIESSGCGREHPAPLIRDYIKNVCDKCNVQVNATTAGIFFDTQFRLETSFDRQMGEVPQPRWNPHYNACYLSGVAQKGIRRLNRIPFLGNLANNTTDFWLPENSPLLTLSQFLDQLKGVYNADWRVVNNTLYFQRKDFWLDGDYVFDFTENAEDRALLIQGLCYEWSGEKTAAHIKMEYTLDGADTAGNNAASQMSGLVSFGNATLNPAVEGVNTKRFPFGPTKFRLDGASGDYILDAYQQLVNSSLLSGTFWNSVAVGRVDQYISAFADYALLITHETTTLPKILLWDGESMENAKCFKPYATGPNRFGILEPEINPMYNNYNGQEPWALRHEPVVDVLGTNKAANNEYIMQRRLASPLIKAALLVNYPMYFEAGFKDTMWDWFHWIDDPNINPQSKQEFTGKIELCCDVLQNKVKAFGDGSNSMLAQKVKLPDNTDGVITEFTISYDTADQYGQYIEIKGKR